MARRFAYPQLADQIERRYRPRQGWCAHPNCESCNAARELIRAELAEAVGGEGALQLQEEAYDEGYKDARSEAYNEAMQIARSAQMQARQAQLEAQRAAQEAQRQAQRAATAGDQGGWYDRGYREGVAEGMRRAPAPTGLAQRSSVVDECLNEVHIIASSNPNMAPQPFANAVRHRMKKLKKK